MTEETMEEQPPAESAEPERSSTEPGVADEVTGKTEDPPAEKEATPEGLCDNCGAVVPLSLTFQRDDQRWHHPPPPPKGFRKPKKGEACGPVLTRWRYRLVYVTSGEHHGSVHDLPFPLRGRGQFEAVERHLAEHHGAPKAVLLTHELLAKA